LDFFDSLYRNQNINHPFPLFGCWPGRSTFVDVISLYASFAILLGLYTYFQGSTCLFGTL
ncbi:hypothetical protein KA005_48555, partial [bacterium]|nr:hypothetical protein [bacterium]